MSDCLINLNNLCVSILCLFNDCVLVTRAIESIRPPEISEYGYFMEKTVFQHIMSAHWKKVHTVGL